MFENCDFKNTFRSQINTLGLDYIDLYLIHTPWGYKNLNEKEVFYKINMGQDLSGTPIFNDFDHVEMWKELEKAVVLGLVKNIGVSNFDIAQIGSRV